MSHQKILLVDDDEIVREVLEELLNSKGYSVTAARDGVDALERLEAELPDIIITDMQMPRCDGAQFLALLCERLAQGPEIPVIVVSGTPEIARSRLRDHGRDNLAIIGKPFQFHTLVSHIKRLGQARHLQNGGQDRG